jgi:hypothetical protein
MDARIDSGSWRRVVYSHLSFQEAGAYCGLRGQQAEICFLESTCVLDG